MERKIRGIKSERENKRKSDKSREREKKKHRKRDRQRQIWRDIIGSRKSQIEENIIVRYGEAYQRKRSFKHSLAAPSGIESGFH